MEQHMLTTTDNPFDPFTHFNEWFTWDRSHGYNSTALLARVVKTSDELSDADQALAIEQAIDEIIQENVTGKHKKLTRTIT